MGSADAEVSLWLCSDAEIAELHSQYFGIEGPTNVISFSQREGEFGEVEPEMLGDIVISFETAARDAAEGGKSLDDEVLFLTIHGLLHLHGFDHEGERASDAPEMEAKEEELYTLVKGQE